MDEAQLHNGTMQCMYDVRYMMGCPVLGAVVDAMLRQFPRNITENFMQYSQLSRRANIGACGADRLGDDNGDQLTREIVFG